MLMLGLAGALFAPAARVAAQVPGAVPQTYATAITQTSVSHACAAPAPGGAIQACHNQYLPLMDGSRRKGKPSCRIAAQRPVARE
jgi:hypothetical protein